MKEWILPTFGVFLCWGLWGFFPKITIKYIDPKSAVIYEVIGGILLVIPIIYFLNFQVETHPKGIALGIVTGLVGFLGSLFFLYACLKGPLTLIVTLSALYPVLTIILSIFFLGETLTVKQGIGIVFALTAMLLVAA